MPISSEPYVGPRPFEQTDRDVFFGRTQEANELVSLMTAHAAVLLYSQSGAGKTSLVKAGLIPLLVDEEKFNVLPPMRVRDNAVAGFKPTGVDNIYVFNAISSICEPGAGNSLARLSLTDYLAKYRMNHGGPAALIFDQFEELFTYYPERWEDRKAFFMQVRDALKQDPLLRVLFSMREDFIAELDPYVCLLPEKLRTRLRLERLRENTALGAVIQPLETVHTSNGRRRFAPNVAESLVHNLLQVKVKTPDGIKKVKGEFVEALQLQVVCQALWESLSDEDVITEYHLEAFGDVDKALGHFYENAIKNTAERTGIKQGKLRQWIERTLITPTGTRGTVFRGETETGGIPNAVVDQLETQRIIRMELRGGAQWYELTHDRFVETVQTCNHNWLLLCPAAEQMRKRFEEKAADWDHNDRQEKYLLDDVELREAERWIKSPEAAEIEPSRELTAFVRASSSASEAKRKSSIERRRRMQQQARMARVFRSLTVAISGLAVVCLVAFVFAGWQWWTARQVAQERERLRLEAVAKKDELEELNKTLEQKNADLLRKDVVIGTSSALSQAYALKSAGKIDEAEKQFQALLKVYEENSDYASLARTYTSLGDISVERGQYGSAITKYDKALEMCKKDEKLLNSSAQVYGKKGDLYLEWGKRKENEPNYKDAMSKYNSALGFYLKAIDTFKKAKNSVGASKAKDASEEAKKRHADMELKLESQAVMRRSTLRN